MSSMVSLASNFFKAIAIGLGIIHDDKVEASGENAHAVKDLTANAKAAENAAIIEDRNAALSRDELIDKLHSQTGVRP